MRIGWANAAIRYSCSMLRTAWTSGSAPRSGANARDLALDKALQRGDLGQPLAIPGGVVTNPAGPDGEGLQVPGEVRQMRCAGAGDETGGGGRSELAAHVGQQVCHRGADRSVGEGIDRAGRVVRGAQSLFRGDNHIAHRTMQVLADFGGQGGEAAGVQTGPPAQSSSASMAASVASATNEPTDPYGVAARVNN